MCKKYVVVDTISIHFAKPVLAELLAHRDEIELVRLPTYSRQHQSCGAVRGVHLRRKVTHNHFFQTMEQPMDAVSSFSVTWPLLLISFVVLRD